MVYSIYAVLVDIDNNRTTIPPISVTVNNQLPTDVTPPTGALTSPPAGSTVSGNTMIQVTAADDQLVDYIEFYIDGQLNGTTQCNGPNCTASYEWNTLEEDEGEHTIQVILFDGWNNNTVLTSVNVWVDNFDDDTIHPNVVIIEPASGQTVSGDVMIEALATDNTGIDRVEFFIETDLVHIDSIGPDYNYTWNTVTLPDDQDYIISLVCYDLIGNEGPSTPITVYLDNYDNITPNGTILYPYAGQSVSGIETISVYADDNDEVSQVEFFIDNVLDYTDTEEPYEYEWDTATEAEDLNHIIGAIITDASVNIFEVPSISVYVNNIPNDTSPPIVIISSPSNGQTVSGTVNFSVLANDDSGISFVEFFIDGESLGTAESEPYTYVWDTTLGLGEHGDQHALSASAEDIAGNVSFAQPILVTVSDTEENHSLGFDGMDDYVNVQYGVDLDMSNALTIAAWVKPIYNNEESTIAMKGSYGYGFALTNNGTSNCSSNNEPNLVYWDQGDCGQAINSSITYEFDQWQHVAVTAEDVGNQLEIYFYVNGEQDGPYYSDELSISNGGDSMALMIGIQWGGWNVFYGNIDDLAIWNAALSAGQISGLAATGSPEEISGLSAHWDFNEGSGSTLYDQTANANHGTITGPVWSTDVP